MKRVEAFPRSNVPTDSPPHASTVQPLNVLTHLARIELAPAEIPALLGNGKLATVAEALKKIGYAHVTLDLQGYRRGSTNEVL
jgi:PP-loop superfamily ATP-utilizing enzyme